MYVLIIVIDFKVDIRVIIKRENLSCSINLLYQASCHLYYTMNTRLNNYLIIMLDCGNETISAAFVADFSDYRKKSQIEGIKMRNVCRWKTMVFCYICFALVPNLSKSMYIQTILITMNFRFIDNKLIISIHVLNHSREGA